MPRTFFTEYEIEDLVKRGVTSLEVNDDVVLTDLAFEKANKLGLKLLRPGETPPCAPERPYLSNAKPAAASSASVISPVAYLSRAELAQRVRSTVKARLNNQVDDKELDDAINKVLDNSPYK